ncbi:DUF485 domain-containing protein [Streptomyces sp. 7N604]|uniref:DUF485 domain-containing protein n=1 Tax=Streptomyces sp. 7N604 TaxID=3457415 RepID=UPI003FD37162
MSPAIPPPRPGGSGPWRGSQPRQGPEPWREPEPWQGPEQSRGPDPYRASAPPPRGSEPPPRPHRRPAAYGAPVPSAFEQLQDDPALLRLRAARRRPVFTVMGTVVALYVLNALLASEARAFMGVRIAGPLNIGLAMSLLQCGTTVWAVWWYTRHARAHFDPEGSRLRNRVEQQGDAR